jgi:hypothetical protein
MRFIRSVLSSHASSLSMLVLALALALSTATPAQAQASADSSPVWVKTLSTPRVGAPSGDPGKWLPWDNQYDRTRGTFTQGGISAAQGQAWDARLRSIAEFLKAAPVLAQPPQGFYPELSGYIAVLNVGGFESRPKQAPLAGGVALYAWPARDVRVDGKGQPKLVPGAHNASFRLELNYVYPPRGGAWMKDAQGEFGPLERQGEYAGYPLIGNSLVITRDGRLPFVPVSQQRALQAFIAHHDKQSQGYEATLAAQRRKAYEDFVSPEGQARRRAAIEADAKRVHPSMAEQTRRKAEAMDRRKEQDLKAEADKANPMSDAATEARGRLDSMDETQRRAPAWLLASRGKQALEIVPEGTPGATPLVAFDTSFFDPRQPRETLRIATIRELHNLADGAQRGSFPQTLYLQLLQQTDWRAFAERFLR